MKHTLYTSDDFNLEDENENDILWDKVVNGGLDICKVCSQYEGALTKECVGHHTTHNFGDFAYNRKIDVQNGTVLLEDDLFRKYLSLANDKNKLPMSENEKKLFKELFNLGVDIGLLDNKTVTH